MKYDNVKCWIQKEPASSSLHITDDYGFLVFGENVHIVLFDIVNVDAYNTDRIFIPRHKYASFFKEFTEWYNGYYEVDLFRFNMKLSDENTSNYIQNNTKYLIPEKSLLIKGDLQSHILIYDLIRSFWNWEWYIKGKENNKTQDELKKLRGYSRSRKFFEETK